MSCAFVVLAVRRSARRWWRPAGRPSAVGQLDGPLHGDRRLHLQAVVLDLDRSSGRRRGLEPGGHFHGAFSIVRRRRRPAGPDLSSLEHAAAQANQALVVGFEQLLVDPRLEVEPFEERRRGEFQQVLEPVRFWASRSGGRLASFMLAASFG